MIDVCIEHEPKDRVGQWQVVRRNGGERSVLAKCYSEATARYLAACVAFCEMMRVPIPDICDDRAVTKWERDTSGQELQMERARAAFIAAMEAEAD